MYISKFAKTLFSLSIVLFIIALLYPIFLEKIYYTHKAKEAISISHAIAKVQDLNYINHNRYENLKKGDVKKLQEIFGINYNDMKYYDYSIFTTSNSYTLYAEPKLNYLKLREISPKKYIYVKKLNNEAQISWQ